MDPVSLLTNAPLLVTVAQFFQNLDMANLVIGVVTLGIGLLGVAYLILTFMATPQPQTEPAEHVAYPGVDRLIVPLLLPIGVGAAIALIITMMSQILLVVPESVATPVALFIALLILVVAAMMSGEPRLPRGLTYSVVGLPLLALVVAGTWAGVVRYNQAQAAAAAAAYAAANAPATSLTEITTDDKFSKTNFNVPAGQAITITVTNQGQAIHNWHVLDVKDDDGKDILVPLTQPGQKNSITFTISKPGTYHFQCDVHPTEMTGTLTV